MCASTHFFDLQGEVSHHPITAHRPRQRFRSTSQSAHSAWHVSIYIRGWGRVTQRHRPLTGNLLPNWVIPLCAASKLHLCFLRCFFSCPPTSAVSVCGWASTDCLVAALIERGRDASLRPHGAIGCIPNGVCTREPWIKGSISEWEGGKPRTTRHYRDQTLLNAAAQTRFVAVAQVISS